MNKVLLLLAVFVLASGCALLGPRPVPDPPDISREKAVRGSGHFDNGRLDRAERDFKAAFYADQAGDRLPALGRDYRNLAALAVRQGDYPAALEYLKRSRDICRGHDDSAGQAECLAGMAAVSDRAGQPAEAGKLIEEALRLASGPTATRAYVLNVRGAHLNEAKDYAGAEVALTEAMGIEAGLKGCDARLRAATLHYLGCAHLAQGRLGEARERLEQALELDREGDYPAGIAADTERLAAVAAASGKAPEALALYEKAFNIYVYLRDARRAEGVLAAMERQNSDASLGLDLTRLREALGPLKAATNRVNPPPPTDYPLGSRSTTQ